MLDKVAMATPHRKVNPNKAFFFSPLHPAYTHPMVKSLFVAVYVGLLLRQAGKCALVGESREQERQQWHNSFKKLIYNHY